MGPDSIHGGDKSVGSTTQKSREKTSWSAKETSTLVDEYITKKVKQTYIRL